MLRSTIDMHLSMVHSCGRTKEEGWNSPRDIHANIAGAVWRLCAKELTGVILRSTKN